MSIIETRVSRRARSGLPQGERTTLATPSQRASRVTRSARGLLHLWCRDRRLCERDSGRRETRSSLASLAWCRCNRTSSVTESLASRTGNVSPYETRPTADTGLLREQRSISVRVANHDRILLFVGGKTSAGPNGGVFSTAKMNGVVENINRHRSPRPVEFRSKGDRFSRATQADHRLIGRFVLSVRQLEHRICHGTVLRVSPERAGMVH